MKSRFTEKDEIIKLKQSRCRPISRLIRRYQSAFPLFLFLTQWNFRVKSVHLNIETIYFIVVKPYTLKKK